MQVEPLEWGTSVSKLPLPFDVVVACDVMYIPTAVGPLLATLAAITGPSSTVYVAHGRNQQARDQFLHACQDRFNVRVLPECKLDEDYKCDDVEVLVLSSRQLQHQTEKGQ